MGFGSSSSNLSPLAPPFTVDRGALARQGTVPLVDVTEPSYPSSGTISSFQDWSNIYNKYYPLTGSVSIRRPDCDPLLPPSEEYSLFAPATSSPTVNNPISSSYYDESPEGGARYSSYLSTAGDDSGSVRSGRSCCDLLPTTYPATSTASPTFDYSLQRSGLWGKGLVDWSQTVGDASLSTRASSENQGFRSNESAKKFDQCPEFSGKILQEGHIRPKKIEFQQEFKPVVSLAKLISDIPEGPEFQIDTLSLVQRPCPPQFTSIEDFKSHATPSVTMTQTRIPQSSQYLTKERFSISDLGSGDTLYVRKPLSVGLGSPMRDVCNYTKTFSVGNDEKKEPSSISASNKTECQLFRKSENKFPVNTSKFHFLTDENDLSVNEFARSKFEHPSRNGTSVEDFGIHSLENPVYSSSHSNFNKSSQSKAEHRASGSPDRYLSTGDLLNASEDSPCWIPRLRKEDDSDCSSTQLHDTVLDSQVFSLQQQSELTFHPEKKAEDKLESPPKVLVSASLLPQASNGTGKTEFQRECNKITSSSIPKEEHSLSGKSLTPSGKISRRDDLQNLEHCDAFTGQNDSQIPDNHSSFNLTGRDFSKAPAETSRKSTPKVCILTLVNALHNLSEVLLFSCSSESCELKDKERNVLKSVMGNLDNCLRNSGDASLIPPPSATFSDFSRPLDFLERPDEKLRLQEGEKKISIGTEPVKESYNFIEKSSPYDLKQENVTQAIKKILVENFSVNGEALPETDLYKNLWLEAEAALCSANYMCRFNRMKTELDERSNEMNIGKQSSPQTCCSHEIEKTTKFDQNDILATDVAEKAVGSPYDYRSGQSFSSFDSIPYMSWLSYPKYSDDPNGFTDLPLKDSSSVSDNNHTKDNEASILASYSILNNWVDESNRPSGETNENVTFSSCSPDMIEDSVLARINILKCRDRMVSQSRRDLDVAL